MQGKISQIMGAVVDVEFLDGQVPKIMNALEIERQDENNLILEVAQHAGSWQGRLSGYWREQKGYRHRTSSLGSRVKRRRNGPELPA